jgi:hypothetical protein
MTNLNGLFTVLALLLGYGIKYFEDRVQHNRTLDRERETRRALRQDAIAERRTQFQRQTLLDLQPALLDLARQAGKMHLHDLTDYRTTGVFHSKAYPDDVNENFRAATALTSMLAVRVNDDIVRVLISAFKSAASDIGDAESPDDSDSDFQTMSTLFVELQERIGVVLRALDEDDTKQQEQLVKKK